MMEAKLGREVDVEGTEAIISCGESGVMVIDE
jgi:hypothetical protein